MCMLTWKQRLQCWMEAGGVTCSQYKKTAVKACNSKIFLSKHTVNVGFQCGNYLTFLRSTELHDALPSQRSGPGFNRTFTVD